MPSDIAVYGLGVMGRNIALNMADHGLAVTVYNRTTSTTEAFVDGLSPDSGIRAAYDLAELAASLARPRVIFLMATAGNVVDRVIEGLLPLLDAGDILIDGGNSNFKDTQRRWQALREKGIRY
ncbi:MAG: NADP-dependent phosphogluconate dehydrogenase, partial [Gammaproteobacteria bacterium]|nr:NADP-dependent phosphogluconate dehydrogenase [Gammaproteobacteria bacterium]